MPEAPNIHVSHLAPRMMKDDFHGNPQGKGLVPVLSALNDARHKLSVPAKQIQQIASELFTSLFVLESRFSFKPVVGHEYWLYRKDDIFSLSLLSPKQWSSVVYGQYIGCCGLHSDLTWTLTLGDEAAADIELMGYISQRREAFEQAMQSAEKVDDVLPVFQGELPFYQRVFASGLASSLGSSMQQSGVQGLSYEQALGLLGHEGQ